MSANETQVGGAHYRASIQHWDYVIRCLHSRYLEGNITKYVTRHRKKNGLQDLQKAQHYLTKLREEYRSGRVPSMRDLNLHHQPFGVSTLTSAFAIENALNTPESFVVSTAVDWVNEADLSRMGKAIEELIENAVKEDQRLQAIKAGAEPSGRYTNQG